VAELKVTEFVGWWRCALCGFIGMVSDTSPGGWKRVP
jgi:hypothetical protein